MQTIFLTGYSNEERHLSMHIIQRVIAKHGDIVDFKFFSDISVTIVVEIEEFKIDKLYDELGNNLALDQFEYLNSVSKRERTVYLNISFTHGTGNLKIPVPPIPG
jgi:signal peptidase I